MIITGEGTAGNDKIEANSTEGRKEPQREEVPHESGRIMNGTWLLFQPGKSGMSPR